VSGATRAEVCAVAMADVFRGDGEILVSCFGTIPAIAARLAKLSFAPDLLLTDGIAHLLETVQPVSGPVKTDPVIEGWMPFRSVFDLLWNGRRHVVMMASQIDRFGNHNFACIGPHAKPKAQLLGMRGAPGNTINHATSYWVGNHSVRVFCDAVDVVCGIGWDKVDPTNPAYRFTDVHRVVSNLGVFDFGGPGHTMRAVSLHPGVEPDEVRSNTSFEVHGLDDAASTRLPSADELNLIRERIDPKSLRDREIKG